MSLVCNERGGGGVSNKHCLLPFFIVSELVLTKYFMVCLIGQEILCIKAKIVQVYYAGVE